MFFYLISCIILANAGYAFQKQDNSLKLPLETNLSAVHFLLWTRKNPGDFEYFDLQYKDEESLGDSNYNGVLRTYFMFHGYTDVGTKQWILDSKSALLQLENCNVISVDYGDLVPGPDYPKAVHNMYKVAEYTASFIDWLISVTPTKPSKLYLTGHSLGAHAAGMTAKYITSGKISRITGLDPAGPMFYYKPKNLRLDKSQADFVDVIHSNSCPAYEGCEGLADPVGHMDSYPNGGKIMTGCTVASDTRNSCSHQLAPFYWMESILAGMDSKSSRKTSKTFVAWPCQDWKTFKAGQCSDCGSGCIEMGFHVDKSCTGLYYLYTNAESPYARGNTQEPPE